MGNGRRRLRLGIGALITVVLSLLQPTQYAAADDVVIHRINFPVEGRTSYSNDFGAPRSGGRTHQGNDLMGSKMQHLLATANGRITSQNFSNGGLSGNFMQLTADDGWIYWYIHLNNDTPGTDDGLNTRSLITPAGIEVGTRVTAGQIIGYMGDSGNAEGTAPHLHFEMHKPDSSVVNPYPNLRLSQGIRYGDYCGFDSNPTAAESGSSASGYWALGPDGGVFSFGGAPFYGSTGGMTLNQPVVGMAATKTGNGYWLMASDGGIFSFGDARFYGSTGAIRLNQPIVGMATTKTGNGYWLVASDGGIFSFGDAQFYGSTGAMRLNRPIEGMSVTSSGRGYWLFASDGGIFSFGDAQFYGSTGAMQLNAPVTGMATTSSGRGYWLVGNDGGIFSFGDAQYYGSVPGTGWCGTTNTVGFVGSKTGNGYWIQTAEGHLWPMGDAKNYGSIKSQGIPTRAIGFAVRP